MPVARSIPILVLAGQSNANNSDIIKATFDRAQAIGGLMVHLAVNGSPLASGLDGGGGDWSAGANPGEGELFRALLRQLDSVLNPSSPSYMPGAYLDGVIWLHGGADIFSAAAANGYAANLAAVNDALTARFGAHELVISALADASLNNRDMTDGQTRNWLAVQAAQVALANSSPLIHLVDPDLVAAKAGLTANQMFQSDYIHYSSTFGYAAALGTALASAVQSDPRPMAEGGAIGYRAGTAQDDALVVTGSGMVQVWAGKGVDSVTLANRSAGVMVIDTGPTNARIIGLDGGPKLFIDLIAVESLRLTPGADDVHLGGGITSVSTLSGNDKVMGGAAADSVWLGNGADYAFGQGGDDRLFGGSGRDSLWGATGNDALFGGRGNDRLGGNEGTDTLTGGAGADVFVFDRAAPPTPDEVDTITDFTNGLDKLNLSSTLWAQISVTSQGNNTLIQALDIAILLQNVKPGQIDAGDFIFT